MSGVTADSESQHPTERAASAARRGDRAGHATLYARVAPAIYAWSALRIEPPLSSRLDPEDVVQEVWWRALQAFDRFDPAKGSFRRWVFGIATHVLIDALRRLGSASAGAPRRETEDVPDDLAAEMTAVSRRVAKDESLGEIVRGLIDLEDEEQKLFITCGLEGRSSKEAAEVLGISADAALKRWQRLRDRLRATLQLDDVLVDP